MDSEEEELDYEGPLFGDTCFQDDKIEFVPEKDVDIALGEPKVRDISKQDLETQISHHERKKDSEKTESCNASSESPTYTSSLEQQQSEIQPITVRKIGSPLFQFSYESHQSCQAENPQNQVVEKGLNKISLLEKVPGVRKQGILKVKENRGSYNSNIIHKCMNFLCTVPSSGVLMSCAKEVFKNACFQEIFYGGCLNKNCRGDHFEKLNITDCQSIDVQNALLFVILKSTSPKIEILKSLVEYFCSCDVVRTLALAKCISKLRNSEIIEFALYLVKHLADLAGKKNAIMWVLFICYSDLGINTFNLLLDRLGVFQQNSTIYYDLFDFLSFRAHTLPCKYLAKLIEDVSSDRSDLKSADFVCVIAEFLDRLPEKEREGIDELLNRFMRQFHISCVNDLKKRKRNIMSSNFPKLLGSKSANQPSQKRVKFVENINHTSIPDVHFEMTDESVRQPSSKFQEDENETQCESIFADIVSDVVYVFNNLCPSWILSGDCPMLKCTAAHYIEEHFLNSVPTDKIISAAEFLIDTSEHPNIKVLEVFVNVLNKSHNIDTLLAFRKCTSKLTDIDSSRLTSLVLSRLSSHLERWDAIEIMLTPNLLDFGNKCTDMFYFDCSLLKSIMIEAINRKLSLLRCVSDEILRRVSLLPSNDKVIIMATSLAFLRKFILKQKLPACPDLMPPQPATTDKFPSYFKSELYKGVTNNYFNVLLMLKYVVENEDGLKCKALDVLYPFLIIHSSKARILNDLMGNCQLFQESSRRSIMNLLGNVGLCIVLRLFEDERVAEASTIFVVLRKYECDLFKQELTFFKITNTELSLILCTLTVECDQYSDAIELLLDRCLKSLEIEKDSSFVNRLNALTEKMFRKSLCKLMWAEPLSLFNGIYSHQKSLTHPMNILEFYESILRTTMAFPWNRKARMGCLSLYLKMEDNEEHVDLQKATYRCLLLNATTEIFDSYSKISSKWELPNIFHPLIKKLLSGCIRSGAYSQFIPSGDQIKLYSSMTVVEIKIYLLWWILYMLRARKRALVDYFDGVNIYIVQDCIQEDVRLPIHFALQKVDVSVNECSNRLVSALKSVIAVLNTSSFLSTLGRGSFYLGPLAVMELSEVVINCCLTHKISIAEEGCTFCLENMNMY